MRYRLQVKYFEPLKDGQKRRIARKHILSIDPPYAQDDPGFAIVARGLARAEVRKSWGTEPEDLRVLSIESMSE